MYIQNKVVKKAVALSCIVTTVQKLHEKSLAIDSTELHGITSCHFPLLLFEPLTADVNSWTLCSCVKHGGNYYIASWT